LVTRFRGNILKVCARHKSGFAQNIKDGDARLMIAREQKSLRGLGSCATRLRNTAMAAFACTSCKSSRACISRWSFAMVGRQGGLKRSAGKVIVDKYYR